MPVCSGTSQVQPHCPWSASMGGCGHVWVDQVLGVDLAELCMCCTHTHTHTHTKLYLNVGHSKERLLLNWLYGHDQLNFKF